MVFAVFGTYRVFSVGTAKIRLSPQASESGGARLREPRRIRGERRASVRGSPDRGDRERVAVWGGGGE